MCSSDSSYAFGNTYSNGAIVANYNNRAKDAAKSYGKAFGLSRFGLGGGASVSDSANNACPSRKFVTGEKFWVTGITVHKDGIMISTFSDPFPDAQGNQVRYYGEIKFPFQKRRRAAGGRFCEDGLRGDHGAACGQCRPGQPGRGQGSQPAQAAAPAAAAPAPMPVIAPPPPPADTPPPTIALGQTVDQVTASFGQPTRIAKLGAKTIYYYKDMKVTFTNGKVSNVQ